MLQKRGQGEPGRTSTNYEHVTSAHPAIVTDMARYLELWRHTDNDGDSLTDDGVDAALKIGSRLTGEYAVAVSTGAQRATQTLGCLITAGRLHIPGGVRVDEGLRSDDEDRWRAIAGEADGKDLSAFRAIDADFVESEARQLGSALRRVLDRLDDGQRALLVGHGPTNEAAVYGLTGREIAPMDKGTGAVIVEDGGSFAVRPA
jgi:broad specificity phosphatase PhoE